MERFGLVFSKFRRGHTHEADRVKLAQLILHLKRIAIDDLDDGSGHLSLKTTLRNVLFVLQNLDPVLHRLQDGTALISPDTGSQEQAPSQHDENAADRDEHISAFR